MVMRFRLERILMEDRPILQPFDEAAWAADRWTDRDALTDLLKDFRVQRQASVAILDRLTEVQWMRETTEAEFGTFDLLWWVEQWAAHDRVYVDQLQRLLPGPSTEVA